MTLSTAVDRTQTAGTGAETVFNYLFKIWASSEVEVIRSNKVAPLSKATLTEGVDYTVQDVGEATGGTITLIGAHAASPPTTDENITTLRKLAYVQDVGVQNQGGFKGNMHEKRFDWIVALVQQLKGIVDRCLKVDEVSMEDPDDLVLENFAGSAPLDTSNFNAILSATEDTVQKAVDVLDDDAAPLASPSLTGTPTAPTAAMGTATTQLATAAFATRCSPVLLDEVVASNQATVDLESASFASYDSLMVEIIDAVPVAATVVLWGRAKDSSGYRAAGEYEVAGVSDNSSATHPANVLSGQAQNAINMSPTDLAGFLGAGEKCNGSIVLSSAAAGPLVGSFENWYQKSTPAVVSNRGAFSCNSVDTYEGFRIMFNTGNVSSGTFRLWGLPKGA